MTKDAIEPGKGGRQRDCFYFPKDHQRAAEYVREKAPIVFEWLTEHHGLDDSDEGLAVRKVFWRIVMEILPKASLVDHAEVMLILRSEANPLSEEDQRRLDDAKRRMELQHHSRTKN